jgi:hypothetical protein
MRKKFLKTTAILFSVAILFSNCASIVSKTSYPVSIDTNPEGVSVSVTDKKGKEIYKGKSPSVVRLKSGAGFFQKAEYEVKLSSPGFDEKVIPVNFKINGWYFGNILIGGVVGLLIIDPATGAMWKIEKNDDAIFETMTKTTVLNKEPALKIIDIRDVPENMKDALVRVK